MADSAAASRMSASVFGAGPAVRRPQSPAVACPCGGAPVGAVFTACCGPVLAGERQAATAEALMRSRYTAYVLGDGDHLFRTWHPRTRTEDADPDPRVRWEGLTVLDVVEGGPHDDEGIVEFRARWVSADDSPVRRGELHERSRFVRRGGRWVYLEAEVQR